MRMSNESVTDVHTIFFVSQVTDFRQAMLKAAN